MYQGFFSVSFSSSSCRLWLCLASTFLHIHTDVYVCICVYLYATIKILQIGNLMQLKTFASVISNSSLIFLNPNFLRCKTETVIGPDALACEGYMKSWKQTYNSVYGTWWGLSWCMSGTPIPTQQACQGHDHHHWFPRNCVEQRSATFFYNRADNKHFWLSGHIVCVTAAQLCVEVWKQPRQ